MISADVNRGAQAWSRQPRAGTRQPEALGGGQGQGLQGAGGPGMVAGQEEAPWTLGLTSPNLSVLTCEMGALVTSPWKPVRVRHGTDKKASSGDP